jgi:hypothetical protein
MKKILLFTIPIAFILEISMINFIFFLLSAKSDFAVLGGIISISVFLYLNSLYYKLFKTQFKNKKIKNQNEKI